jgi:hypothetical protein
VGAAELAGIQESFKRLQICHRAGGKMKKESFFAGLKRDYLHSFRNLSPKIWVILLFDALFFIVTMLLSQGFSALLGTIDLAQLQDLQAKLTQSLTGTDLGQGAIYTQQLTHTFNMILTYVILFVIFVVLNWSVWRMLIYQMIYEKKFSAKELGKFFAANLAITVLLVGGVFLLASIIQQSAAPKVTLAYILMLAYFTTLFYHFMSYTGSFKSGIKAAFAKGVGKVHIFVIAFALIAITAVIAFLPFSIIGSVLPQYVRDLLYFVPLLFTLAWSRIYLSNVVKSALPKK